MSEAHLPFDPLRPREIPKPKRKGFTARQVAAVFIKCDGRCAKCAQKVKLDGYQIDHIVPVSMLGEHELENWQLLCKDCHKPKTRQDNSAAKKAARRRGETGQLKRRRERGPVMKSRGGFGKKPEGYVSPLSKDAKGYRKQPWKTRKA